MNPHAAPSTQVPLFAIPTSLNTVGWKVASLSLSMASVRYRAMLPLLALEQRGFKCRIFSTTSCEQLDGLDLLIIVKSFSAEDLALAQQAVNRGVPVVIDLCDNIFVADYGISSALNTSPAQIFLAMARLAKCVVVTTEPLAQVLRSRLDNHLPVYVIPDGLESRELLEQMRDRLSQTLLSERKSLAQKIRQRVMRFVRRARTLRTAAIVPLTKRIADRFVHDLYLKLWVKRLYWAFDKLRRHVRTWAGESRQSVAMPPVRTVDLDAKRILWFGNHGARHARFGMLDLLEIREPLETIAKEFKVELVVVSNNPEKYARYIEPLSIPSSYVEWSPASIKKQLSLASVVVVPNTLDAFSLCKSANRTASALLAGVPVVATATPALDVLASSVVLDDFLGGLRLYLGDKERADADVARGRQVIHRTYGQEAIAAAWVHVNAAATHTRVRIAQPDAQLILVLHLIQDLDLALPILLAALERQVNTVVWCSTSLLDKSPRVIRSLIAHNIQIWPVADGSSAAVANAFPPSATVLLTIAETNLGPHRFTRNLTNVAKQAGLFTATLQHGFENVGLTYDDEIHRVDRINFAADRVYLWGEKSTLHSHVPSETRDKCIPVGCPKPATIAPADISRLLPNENRIIGVFENLHWHRYSNKYREFFISGILALASKFSDINFLVKPHHAGKWLTGQNNISNAELKNLIVVDPAAPEWEQHTASGLLGRMAGVISTPSTVVLDAARASLPVAVVEFEMNFDKYSPLFKIKSTKDWEKFITKLDNVLDKNTLIEVSSDFVAAAILNEDGAARIVDDLMLHFSGARNAR